MIVKMIQNVETKMESQIVWRQGLKRCKKGLTAPRRNLKKSQYIMTSAINEIKAL